MTQSYDGLWPGQVKLDRVQSEKDWCSFLILLFFSEVYNWRKSSVYNLDLWNSITIDIALVFRPTCLWLCVLRAPLTLQLMLTLYLTCIIFHMTRNCVRIPFIKFSSSSSELAKKSWSAMQSFLHIVNVILFLETNTQLFTVNVLELEFATFFHVSYNVFFLGLCFFAFLCYQYYLIWKKSL